MIDLIQERVKDNQEYIAWQCQVQNDRAEYNRKRNAGGTYWFWVTLY